MNASTLLRVGGLGSSVALFLTISEKFVLGACSKHFTAVIHHPSAWTDSLTVDTKMIQGMSDVSMIRLLSIPKQIRSMSWHLRKYSGFDGRLLRFVELINQSIGKTTLRELTVRHWHCKEMDQSLQTVGRWAPRLESLRIDDEVKLTPTFCNDEQGKCLNLHTLKIPNCSWNHNESDLLHVLASFVPPIADVSAGTITGSASTLQSLTLMLAYDHTESKKVTDLLSKMQLTTLEVSFEEEYGEYDERNEFYSDFYSRLGQPEGKLVHSLESFGYQPVRYYSGLTKFTNLQHLTVPASAMRVREAISTLASTTRLNRLTIDLRFVDRKLKLDKLWKELSSPAIDHPIQIEFLTFQPEQERIDQITQLAAARAKVRNDRMDTHTDQSSHSDQSDQSSSGVTRYDHKGRLCSYRYVVR